MRHPRLLTGLAALALLATGCQSSGSHGQLQVQVTPSTAAPTDEPSPTLPVVPTVVTVSPTPSPKPKPPSYDVVAVKRQLTALHYYAGPLTTALTANLASAVMAFQKVQGIGADGGVGKVTLAALKAPKIPALKGTGSGTRVEIDLTRQVLYVAHGATIVRILPVSSGSGRHYLTKSGQDAVALSPVGYYTVERRILGAHEAPLGTLYDPQYFYRGWAIHGSNSVPAYPASHGCIRVTRSDAKYLLEAISVGTPVYVYGGRYTFPAGSSAPGTNDPGGDVAEPTPTPSPTPSHTPSPTPSPLPTLTPSPSPTPSVVPTH